MSYNRNTVFSNLMEESKNSFVVADEYRTNPLSHQPGGCTIKVKYKDGSIRIYDKIKNIDAYTSRLVNVGTVVVLEASLT